jgi:hypothetical protein
MKHAPGAILLMELRACGVVVGLGFLFGIQVVEVTEKLVEAVVGGEELIQVPEVVFAELTGRVPQRLEKVG